eukprot:m.208404 g.208404  ORF g.208404 m.208404 type:complete len:115 (+) comp39708_c0_seq1:112-456(+)
MILAVPLFLSVALVSSASVANLDPCGPRLPGCNSCPSHVPTPGGLQTDVSADGQGGILATIGLQVPRGSGGREPGLALKYSSTAGNGAIGLGWKLSYLPTITRCPRTKWPICCR